MPRFLKFGNTYLNVEAVTRVQVTDAGCNVFCMGDGEGQHSSLSGADAAALLQMLDNPKGAPPVQSQPPPMDKSHGDGSTGPAPQPTKKAG